MVAEGPGPGEEVNVLWRPQEGKQTLFLQSWAYECLYGGAAGGGKTDALLGLLAEQVWHPAYRGLFLRETFAELDEAVERVKGWWPQLGGVWNATAMKWRFPSGAIIEFGYLEDWKDTKRYQGRQFTVICYDELGNLAEERCWLFLMGRNRATAKGLYRFMRASANPGGKGEPWLLKRFIRALPWDGTIVEFPDIEGGQSLTRAFIFAKLEDNKILMEEDPGYLSRLNAAGDRERRQLRHGEWGIGSSLALEELDESVHIIPAFQAPAWWPRYAAFDWGYAHPFCFAIAAVDEMGTMHVLDTIHNRLLTPDRIAARIVEAISLRPHLLGPSKRFPIIHAGHDVFAEQRARNDFTPTIAEEFLPHGLLMTKANVARVLGLNNLRRYLQWKNTGPDGGPGAPKLVFHDTPGNRHTFEVLESMLRDPKDPEDAMKRDYVDGNDTMQGDDPYDCIRYLCASRPIEARSPEETFSGCWDPKLLAQEAARKATVRPRVTGGRRLLMQLREIENGF